MIFYCPSCQKEVDVEPTETTTTKSGRVAYKANCPTCEQPMVEFIPPEEKSEQNTKQAGNTQTTTDPQSTSSES